MATSNGIIHVAFGEDYDRLAAYTVNYSKKFTTLPVTVLTNLKKRDPLWEQIPNVEFIYIDKSSDDNRDVKTQLHLYTPYKNTLYIDIDAVIHKPGIEVVFDMLGDKDAMFKYVTTYDITKKNSSFFHRHYDPILKKNNAKNPINIYHGGFFCFQNTEATEYLFDLWNRLWKEGGQNRDMPPLACAVQQITDKKLANISSFVNGNELFNHKRPFSLNPYQYKGIVKHRWSNGREFAKIYGLPLYKANKPFYKRRGSSC